MNNVIDVDMGKIMTSSKESPIIGTSALATCVGFLAIDHNQHKAIVSHISPNHKPSIKELIDVMRTEGFISEEQYQQCIKNLLFFEEYDLFVYNASLRKILSQMDEYQVSPRPTGDKIEIRIIDGFHTNHTNVSSNMKSFFNHIRTIFEVNNAKLTNGEVEVQMLSSNEGFLSFYYDANKDQFVTQEVMNPTQEITKKI